MSLSNTRHTFFPAFTETADEIFFLYSRGHVVGSSRNPSGTQYLANSFSPWTCSDMVTVTNLPRPLPQWGSRSSVFRLVRPPISHDCNRNSRELRERPSSLSGKKNRGALGCLLFVFFGRKFYFLPPLIKNGFFFRAIPPRFVSPFCVGLYR